MQITSILSLTLGLLGAASAQQCQNNTIYCGRNLKNNLGWNNDGIFNALLYKNGDNGGPSRAQLNGKFNGALFKCVRTPRGRLPDRIRLSWVVSCGNGNCGTVANGDGYCVSKEICAV